MVNLKNGSAVVSEKGNLKMETMTIGLQAKIDIINNDLEETRSELENLEWKLQEIESLANELEEVKDLLEKLGKALGVELV
tara:strand:- start:995 stop:1237 length:243 start_codon:yes stop_codon:yes gene_type:complete